MLPIVRHVVNFFWFFFKCAILLGSAAAVAAGFYWYRHFDDSIRGQIETLIAEHYASARLKPSIASAELIPGEGIKIRGLSIVEPGAAGPRGELLSLEEVFLACNTDLQEFLSKGLQVTEVVVRRPKLWVTRRSDGSWSAKKLVPWPSFGRHPPTLKVENGTIEVFDPLTTPSSTQVFRDVNLTLTPPPPLPHASLDDEIRRVQGTFSGDHFRQLVVEGQVDPKTWKWSLGGTLEGLDLSPELRAALPAPFEARLPRALAALRGQAELSFRVNYDPALPSPYTFDVSARLSRGRIEDARLPHALTDVRAVLHCDNRGYSIDDMAAHDGQSGLWLTCRHEGYELNGPMVLQAELRQFDLDWQWLRVLPDSFRELHDRYVPMGQIDADVKLIFDGRNWQPEAVVRCNSLSFTYRDFQYRLEYGKGTLVLKNDLLTVNLNAQSGNHAVRVAAEVQHPLDAATAVGFFEAKGDDLPLDEKLTSALPPRGAAIVRTLDPHGSFAFYFKVSRDQPDEKVHKLLIMDLHRCAIKFEQFPYPIGNVRGGLTMNDDQWTFERLEGTNSTGRMTGKGSLLNTPTGPELALAIDGTAIPLEKDLRDALPPNMQQLWEKLRPRGAIDLTAKITYLPQQRQLGVTVCAQPQGDSTWIEPVVFPYRMEKLRGLLQYNNGHVTLENLRAWHGPVSARADGVCDFLPDGSWTFHLENVAVDRIGLDRELISALPGRLRRSLAELNPTGPCNLYGTADFQSAGQPNDPVQSGWNVRIGCQRGGIECGVKLENLHGEVGLVGGFDGQNMQCRGELDINSLTCHDVQFTDLRGPFWIDDRQVLLGSWVVRPRQGTPAIDPTTTGRKPRPLTAKVFGGAIFGDGRVALGPVPKYNLEATLSDADLAQCIRETSPNRQNLQGKILADITLRGAGRNIYSLGGRGGVHLREANIYELPLMIRLLKILSVRPPDTTAFSQSDIDFTIRGNHVYLDPIVFRGDAISLRGKGEMDFDSRIDMTLHAAIGRGELHVPVLRDVFGKVSEQIMLIRVLGTLQDPQVKSEALPQVNQFLQFFQGERPPQPTPPPDYPQARQSEPQQPPPR